MNLDVQERPAPALIPLGTIRRGCSLRLSREEAEPGQWRFAVDAIEGAGDMRLGAVVVAPGWPPASIWEPEAAEYGIVSGSRIDISIVETCEEITDAIQLGVPLNGRHGFKPASDCPYPIPMHEQVGVAWVD